MWLPLMTKLSSIRTTVVNLAGICASGILDFDPEALGRQISMIR